MKKKSCLDKINSILMILYISLLMYKDSELCLIFSISGSSLMDRTFKISRMKQSKKNTHTHNGSFRNVIAKTTTSYRNTVMKNSFGLFAGVPVCISFTFSKYLVRFFPTKLYFASELSLVNLHQIFGFFFYCFHLNGSI